MRIPDMSPVAATGHGPDQVLILPKLINPRLSGSTAPQGRRRTHAPFGLGGSACIGEVRLAKIQKLIRTPTVTECSVYSLWRSVETCFRNPY